MSASTFRDDVLEGYMDGFADSREDFPAQSNRSEAYRHGWLNGRDDRLGRPRAAAAALRSTARSIAEAEASAHNV